MPAAHLQFVGGNSAKFWKIRVEGSTTYSTYGKIGSDGTTTVKDHGSDAKAEKFSVSQIASKVKKGYEHVKGGVKRAAAESKAAPAAKKSRKTAVKAKAAPASAAADGLDGLVICITGTVPDWKRADLKAAIVAAGATLAGTVSKKVTHLVLAPGGAGTSKHTQAEGRDDVTIVDHEWLLAALNGDGGDDGDDDQEDDVEDDEDEDMPAAAAADGLDGLVLCITGTVPDMTRAAVAAAIKEAGGTLAKSVTKKVTHLVLAPGGEGTTKHSQAQAKGIEIVDDSWLLRAIGKLPPAPAAGAGTGAGAGAISRIGKGNLAAALTFLDSKDVGAAQGVSRGMRDAAHAALAVGKVAVGGPCWDFVKEIVPEEGSAEKGDVAHFTGEELGETSIFEGCKGLRWEALGEEPVAAGVKLSYDNDSRMMMLATVKVPPSSPWSRHIEAHTCSIKMTGVEGRDYYYLPTEEWEMQVVQRIPGAEGEGDTYIVQGKVPYCDELDGYDAEWVSAGLTQLYERYLKQPASDGVAYLDGTVHAALVASMNKHVDELAAAEPADYHPNSNEVVRDLVHPALYSYVRGLSPFTPSAALKKEPKAGDHEGQKDMWGRKYEDSSYQWLPSVFDISQQGKCRIESYINNLDRAKYGELYGDVERLFEVMLPHLEGVWGYGKAIAGHVVDDSGEMSDEEDLDSYELPCPPISLRGRKLQVITKIVDYEVKEGQIHDGVWHVEGMSHENVVATGLYILKRDANVKGGTLSFKRPMLKCEASHMVYNSPQERPQAFNDFMAKAVNGHAPVGSLETPEGRMLFFPNSHVHRLSSLTAEGGPGKRRIVVFWLINPDRYIVSTAEVPPQQGSISLESAKENRLKLMQERKFHKQSWNVREVELCEH